jgi:hypothetical protein
LLNSSLTVEASRALASRIKREAGDDLAKQVEHVFAVALQRAPDKDEQRACAELVRQRSLPELCRVLLNLNEFIYVD